MTLYTATSWVSDFVLLNGHQNPYLNLVEAGATY